MLNGYDSNTLTALVIQALPLRTKVLSRDLNIYLNLS